VFNGQSIKVAAVYSQGYNYVKLDDLCKYLDIDVALDQPNKAVYLDKTKPYTGVRPINGTSEYMCRVVGGLEQLPAGTYSPFSYLAAEYQVKYTVAEGNEENMRACMQSPDCIGNSIYLVDNGYFYFSAGAFARDNNIDVAYDVDSNAARLDKFKLWAGDYETNWDNYFGLGIRYVDAAGRPLCSIGSFGTILTGEYFAAPGTLKDGVTITAQYETHRCADVYRVTEYASSLEFPIKKFVMYPTGLQFSFYASAPGAEDLVNALTPVLNCNNTWSNEFLQRQKQVISVTINGEAAEGFLEGGGPVNDEPALYQYIFAKPYQGDGIKTICIRLLA